MCVLTSQKPDKKTRTALYAAITYILDKGHKKRPRAEDKRALQKANGGQQSGQSARSTYLVSWASLNFHLFSLEHTGLNDDLEWSMKIVRFAF